MTIYLLGVTLTFTLCLIIHCIEYKEGVNKDTSQDFVLTMLMSSLSWVGVLLCVLALYHYFSGDYDNAN